MGVINNKKSKMLKRISLKQSNNLPPNTYPDTRAKLGTGHGNLNIVFFGTPHFAEIVLEKLIHAGYKPSLVITAPDKPVGRKKELIPSPVKILSQKENISIAQPEKLDQEFVETYNLTPSTYNLFIVAAYGKIIPQKILDIPRYGALNIHPSLLPKYRGASPIQTSILNGDKKTGVTVMLMDEKMDHGPILAQQELAVINSKSDPPAGRAGIRNKFKIPMFKITAPKLSDILAEQGAELLTETIPKLINKKIKPKKQNHKKATYTKIIKREDGLINWNKSADYIERQLRAFTPWPGIYTIWEDKRLKILELNTTGRSGRPVVSGSGRPVVDGQVIKYNDGFAIQTKNRIIVPSIIQLEGKNSQTAKEFLNGHPKIIGSIFM